MDRESYCAMSSPEKTWPEVDRRRNPDRRGKPTGFWRSLIGQGSRARGRRKGETSNIYVDVFRRRDLLLVLMILVLNILDAAFTLDYLQKGGTEANPVASSLIEAGETWFVYAKCILVALCLVFLMLHKTFKYVRAALLFLLSFYGVLLVYHIYLQLDYQGPLI